MWQAGSRKLVGPAGFQPDKNNWGWNWLERWMAVRPWENRFLDINLKDGFKLNENGTTEGKNAVSMSKTPSNATGRKPISTLQSNFLNHKSITSMFEGSGSSSTRSASLMTSSALHSSRPKQKSSDEACEEVTS